MAFMLAGYLHYPFEVTLAEFRAKTIDIARHRLRHTETSIFDLWHDLDPRLKVNLKISNIFWKDLVESFRTSPRGARCNHWFSS